MTTSGNQPHRFLATDLDGTFIPIRPTEGMRAGQSEAEAAERFQDSQQALWEISRAASADSAAERLNLIYVTGRHLESIADAIVRFGLPVPQWILCDVGSSLYVNIGLSDAIGLSGVAEADEVVRHFQRVDAYDAALWSITGRFDGDRLRDALSRQADVRLQEDVKQALFKLSYYADQDSLDDAVAAFEEYLIDQALPFGIIQSVDPFNGDGLIDVMPRGVSKAFALQWWIDHCDIATDKIAFAGDSGNDLAAMISGIPSIVVGNADRALADRVLRHHEQQGWTERLFLADAHSTAGVLQGCQWFELLDRETDGSDAKLVCPSTVDAWDLHRFLGATPLSRDRTRFAVFAPQQDQVGVVLLSGDGEPRPTLSLQKTPAGYHIGVAAECSVGTRYQYELTGGARRGDPASRFQGDGVHGPSQVVRTSFPWTDAKWPGVRRNDLVIYELHVGAFTRPGTFVSAIDRLDELVDLGVTAVEVMPVNACAGRWNWGYDGVSWFAPTAAYGTPDDFRRFVDAAHAKGLAVILDVVYNHFGPEGNYLHDFGGYVSKSHQTVWGDAPNLDEPPASVEVRRFLTASSIHWLEEYHVDGLRVDAIHCIADDSEKHWVAEFSEAIARWSQSRQRPALLVAESNVYDAEMLQPLADGGMGFDAQWCDDFLHSVFAVVRPGEQLSNREYRPKTDLAQVLEKGFVFEGTVRKERQRRQPRHRVDTRGLVYSIQNHDFIGNHPLGQRLHQLTSPATQRAAAALLILSPSIPMIFMGEEFACEHPFSFFVDFGDEVLRLAVVAGRIAEYPQHDWSGGTSPIDPAAFESSKIGAAADGDPAMRRWYQQLIGLRRRWIESDLLSDANLQVRCDTDKDEYSMIYTDRRTGGYDPTTRGGDPRTRGDDPKTQWVVAVRLGGVGGQTTPLIGREDLAGGEVLLDSAADEFRGDGESAGALDQAVVIRRNEIN